MQLPARGRLADICSSGIGFSVWLNHHIHLKLNDVIIRQSPMSLQVTTVSQIHKGNKYIYNTE